MAGKNITEGSAVRGEKRAAIAPPTKLVILSEVAASLREAAAKSKDLYSSRIRLQQLKRNATAPPCTIAGPKGSFDSECRFAKRIDTLRSG